MPRGEKLTEFEKGQILALHHLKKSNISIAKHIKRSEYVVKTFLKVPQQYGTKRRPERPKILQQRDLTRLNREASKGKLSVQELKNDLELSVSVRRVRQILHSNPNLAYKKRKGKPKLTLQHKNKRMDFARQKVTWSEQWSRTVFSDEKKFNLDDPDGFQYYWSDLRKDEQIFSRRQNGGGSVMVWGAFCERGKSDLALLNGRQTAQNYIQTLENELVSFATEFYR